MSKKEIYESIMKNVAREVKKAINESDSNFILEEYGLNYIFDELNEDFSIDDAIQKFKLPLATALQRVKDKFGKLSCSVLADIVKKALAKGRKTLLGVLTLITLFSGTAPVFGRTTKDFDSLLVNSTAVAALNMANARGYVIDLEYLDKEYDNFVELLKILEKDEKNLYAVSGVGYSESEGEAFKMAKEEALLNLKRKYGDNAVEEYDIKFKTVSNVRYAQTVLNGKNSSYKEYYTTIVVAYQEK